MEEHYTGIHWILATLPIWATALAIVVVTLVAINELRDLMEGVPYQVSRSALYGEAGLIITVLIAATILQRGKVVIPSFVQGGETQLQMLVMFVIVGLAVSRVTMKSRSNQLADIYHDAVVAPLFVFFGVTLLPVVYYGGTAFEKIIVYALINLWFIFFVTDVLGDRMNQRRWLTRRGLKFKD
jgi:hypothetical protein